MIIESSSPNKLQQGQLTKLNELLAFAKGQNAFYQNKLEQVQLPLSSLEQLRELPLTLKQELVEDQKSNGKYGSNHSYSLTDYIRYHQTSGTSGSPLKVLDTAESWAWWEDCWLEVYRSSGVTKQDRVFLAFSFGPFIGFWAAFEAAKKNRSLVITGGSQSTKERLYCMMENEATVLLCTPSYALHLAEVAEELGIDIKNSTITKIITAGEPGGSVPSTRKRIETLWGAKLFDHVGMTEMGAYGYSCSEQKGIHVNEAEFIAEVLDPETLEPVAVGEKGELVLTNLGRYGYPLIRYRTADVVLNSEEVCACGNPYKFFPGGVLGRADDMVVIRGINIYPSSIEAIVREFAEVKEFRIVYYTENGMDQIKVQVETDADLLAELATLLRDRVGLRIAVDKAEAGSLPRFTMKSKRVLDERVDRG
ncbi:AMP-binding protein [Sporosarcina sp. 179-K 3D1 HS]|uniref:phenylacetate--CoA ligase family protein n=1 Tax=Sporosarcina sp. 179-K 3D1 HS TaxID=3232169 RepID=UPI0039A2D65E